jgi:hypothetical protein
LSIRGEGKKINKKALWRVRRKEENQDKNLGGFIKLSELVFIIFPYYKKR